MRSVGNGDSSDADRVFIGLRSMKISQSQACSVRLELSQDGLSGSETHRWPRCAGRLMMGFAGAQPILQVYRRAHPSTAPGLPFSTAKVFSVEILAFGSVTSEIARSRIVICLVSTSTLT